LSEDGDRALIAKKGQLGVDWGPEELTIGVRRGLDGIQQLHGLNVIEVNLVLQNNDKSLSVQLDSQNGGWESQLAYRGLTL
jgi:hypothetical protein